MRCSLNVTWGSEPTMIPYLPMSSFLCFRIWEAIFCWWSRQVVDSALGRIRVCVLASQLWTSRAILGKWCKFSQPHTLIIKHSYYSSAVWHLGINSKEDRQDPYSHSLYRLVSETWLSHMQNRYGHPQAPHAFLLLPCPLSHWLASPSRNHTIIRNIEPNILQSCLLQIPPIFKTHSLLSTP